MTLLDRCQELRRQIGRRDSLRLADKDAEAVRERTGYLKSIRESTAGAAGKIRVLLTKGITVTKLPDVNPALNLLQEYQRRLAENLIDGLDYGRLKRSIVKISKEFLDVAEKALYSVKRDLPTIEETFLKQVETIPAYQDRVARIRMERNALFDNLDLHMMDAEQLSQFMDRREALRRLADQLKPDEFPKEVLDFFKAARQQGGAPLGKLTDPVRQWLAERDQLKHLRITIVGQ